ncbi:MAG: 4'-phosphopantetheinyl transferase superfamily protein [Bacteroidetes bacterium]|nr:4'-phosphopantetheinyl transferase superfamily protein [Bacteroidota bacterium]
MRLIYNKIFAKKIRVGICEMDEHPGIPTKEKHRLHTLSLASRLLGIKDIEIAYNGRIPCLVNQPWNVSVSHSGNHLACILTDLPHAGIDIEQISPRIEKIANRFLHESEKKTISGKNRLEKLYVIWCAKETLYKIFKKGGLIFSENLIIDPFEYSKKGEISGAIQTKDFVRKFYLFYEEFRGHILVFGANE